jgi:hypothetical protein
MSNERCKECSRYLYFGEELQKMIKPLRDVTPGKSRPTGLGYGTFNVTSDDFIDDLEEKMRYDYLCHCNGRNLD